MWLINLVYHQVMYARSLVKSSLFHWHWEHDSLSLNWRRRGEEIRRIHMIIVHQSSADQISRNKCVRVSWRQSKVLKDLSQKFVQFTCRSLYVPIISWTAWPAQWRRRPGRRWGGAGGRSCAGASPGERARRWGPGPGRETGGRAETARGPVSWQTELPGSGKWH